MTSEVLDGDDLIRAVAKRIFGYDRSVLPMVYDLVSQAVRGVPVDQQERWQPLCCLDHCWLVVEELRKHGWYLELCSRGGDMLRVKFCLKSDHGWGTSIEMACEYGEERRAIMRLASGINLHAS